MSTFKTLFNYHGRVPCPQCSKTRQEFVLDKSTNKIVPDKVTNIYERIQSYYESTRIDRKIERYKFGDVTALGVPGGSSGDFSNVPTNLAEVLQSGTSADTEFGKLSPDIKELFGNDSGQFLTALRDGSYDKIIRDYAAREIERLGSIGQAGGTNIQNQGGTK